MLLFKCPNLKDEFNEITDKLKTILFAIAGWRDFYYHKDVVITSLIRRDNPNSVHYYGRGADLRIHDWTNDEISRAKLWIDTIFPYGKGKPTFYPESDHIHIQVP